MTRKLLIVCVALLFFSLGAVAQQQTIEKRSEIPFAFKEFKDAKVLQPFGRYVKAKANIMLKNAALCYTENGKILQAYAKGILGVEFDSVKYMKVDSLAMGKVIASKNYNYLVCVTTIDMDQYKQETHGDENLPFFNIEELGTFLNLENDPRNMKTGYPLKDTYYFIARGQVIPAMESKFKKAVRPERKSDFKKLMGDRFWSWKDEKSLTQLLDFLP